MLRRHLIIRALLLAALLAHTVDSQAAPRKKLNKKLTATVTQTVIPAYRQGRPLDLLAALSPLATKLPEAQRQAVDGLLEEHDLPPMGRLLAETRMSMVYQNLAKHLPKPTLGELLLVIPALREQIQQTLAEQQEHPALMDPLPRPDNFEGYKDLFWKIHVYEQRLSTARSLAEYGRQLLANQSKARLGSLPQQQRAILATDFGDYPPRITALYNNLQERKIELRIQRLELAGKLLDDSQDYKGRFQAAYVADLDGDLLSNFFKSQSENGPQLRFSRSRLNQDDLVEHIKDQVQTARKQAGDLVTKSRLLHAGLHWWKRGRYGRGPDGGGLLKSVQALQSPQTQFALYMPVTTPQPTDPAQQSSQAVPKFDRRHHYIWMFEYRTIKSNVSTNTSKQTHKSGTKTTLTHFY